MQVGGMAKDDSEHGHEHQYYQQKIVQARL
jgi:hypothetical protein